MELRHLRYFVAVAEELNVRQAANRLHLSQPPLSRQIHDLEDEVGTKLFVRSKSGMRLTEAGRTFLTEARLILAQSQRAIQLAQAASRGEAGHLDIAYSIDFCLRRFGRFWLSRSSFGRCGQTSQLSICNWPGVGTINRRFCMRF